MLDESDALYNAKLKGKLERIKEGELKGKIDMVKGLLSNINVEVIMNVSNLTLDEINKIKDLI